MEEKKLYVLVYRYLLARICFGFYPKGEYLPSIQKLSRLFGVSTMAVRGALKLLEEEGYISSLAEKRAMVVYDSDRNAKALPSLIHVSAEELQVIHQSFDLIFPSIFFDGLSMCSENDIQELKKILKRPTLSWDIPTVDFLAYLVGVLKNQLLLSLYYDVMLYSYPSHLAYLTQEADFWKSAYQALQIKLKKLLDIKESGDLDALWDMVQQSYPEFGPDYKQAVVPQCSSTYHWGKIQICYTTASVIVRRIYTKQYPVDSFLPSARILSEEFSIPVITMRRSIALLNDLGVTESINGKGTRVLDPTQSIHRVKWHSPAIQKNILLYLESLHILAITCRPLALYAFPLLDRKDRKQAALEIRQLLEKGYTGLAVGTCLEILIGATKLSALKTIYDKLMNLLIWGQPLSYIEPILKFDLYMKQISECLETQDTVMFCSTLDQALSATFLSSQKKAVSIGIDEAGRLLLPEKRPDIKEC